MDYDLIVVGGGIGGSALAAVMAGAGSKVLLLEASEIYEDRVRGEWISPWGVTEVKRLGLHDLLVGAGGHHIETHISYDENRTPEEARMHLLFPPREPSWVEERRWRLSGGRSTDYLRTRAAGS